jgi:hypothetical protein
MLLLDGLAAGKGYDMLEGDWTAFDSSQNNVEHHLFMLQLEAIGCPEELRKMFFAMMTRRTVYSPFASLVVNNKKDSGRVDTLIGNTTFNAGVMLTLVDPDTIDHVLFKGDDSLIMGHGLRVNTERVAELERNCGYHLKLKTRKIGEFVSFIVNENGSALCLPRIAAKVATRSYRDKEDFDNNRAAVADTIRPAMISTSVASAMTAVNAAHYRIPQEHFDELLSFLVNYTRGKIPFKSTVAFENLTLTCDITDIESARGEPNKTIPATTTTLAKPENIPAETQTQNAEAAPIHICVYDKKTVGCRRHFACGKRVVSGHKRFAAGILSALS